MVKSYRLLPSVFAYWTVERPGTRLHAYCTSIIIIQKLRISLIRATATIYFAARLCSYYSRVATIWGRHLFLWKARQHQRQLDRVWLQYEWVRQWQLLDAVSSMPLSPAVSRGNDSYNTNTRSASVLTVVRDHSHMCVCATFTSCRGYCSRVVIQELQNVQLLIKGRPLLEGGIYSKKYGITQKYDHNGHQASQCTRSDKMRPRPLCWSRTWVLVIRGSCKLVISSTHKQLSFVWDETHSMDTARWALNQPL